MRAFMAEGSMNGWHGVDLDGTLAFYDGWAGGKIGKPIPKMVARVKAWLIGGWDVRIVTARVASSLSQEDRDEQRSLIEKWCVKHLGQRLTVTSEKDFYMIDLHDDRVVQVVQNTGRLIEDCDCACTDD